ncbi:hypothetical protein A2U01_0018859, partial [Trifolium medium]|nr:hypothetical protein [Trifolium medium]
MEEDNNQTPPHVMNNNNPKRLAHIVRPGTNQRRMEMKTRILQLLYANLFTGFDHEDPINHLTKFYEVAEAIGASFNEEENVFMRLFPHSLIGRAKH